MAVRLTADLIEAFSLTYLSPMYDEPKPTAQFHRDGWALYCDPEADQAGIAAPRGHAKSTSFTFAYGLATVLFRVEDYMILISTNEELAIEHLGDITLALTENEPLIEDFQIKGFVTNSKTEIVVEMKDGHQFRILARGSGQKLRGRKWRGKRPGLILCDDLEDDEQVESKERRIKFARWFLRAVKPALRRGGKLRVHGTILHEDSLLANLLKDPTWRTKLWKAHKSFDDFSEILWPEQFTEEELRKIQKSFIAQFDSSGYSQEYLNDPFDNTEAYLKREDFLEMRDEDWLRPMRVCVGIDLAISKADKANRTSMTVGGQTAENVIQFIDQFVGRWDTPEIVEKLFLIQELHEPEYFFIEDGVIWKAIEPMLNQEMGMRNVFLNIQTVSALRDKATKGRAWQRRMRAKACRFDKNADWYPNYEAECLKFTGYSEATLDDQFDSSGILARGFDWLPLQDETDFMDEDEMYARGYGRHRRQESDGRSAITGY